MPSMTINSVPFVLSLSQEKLQWANDIEKQANFISNLKV